jgi:hypothetical protein
MHITYRNEKLNVNTGFRLYLYKSQEILDIQASKSEEMLDIQASKLIDFYFSLYEILLYKILDGNA